MNYVKVGSRLYGGAALALAIVVASFIGTGAFYKEASASIKGSKGGGNLPPEITQLSVVQVPGQKFRVTGYVSDENPAGCGVVVSGSGTGVGLCDTSGYFDVTVDVAQLQELTVTPGDGVQNGTPITGGLSNDAPIISVTATKANGQWTFSGSVADEAAAGLTVTLSGPTGVDGQTAVVDANGNYSITVTLAAGSSGIVTASVTDWYSASDDASTYFSD